MYASFPFNFDSGVWDLIVLVPVHCNSIYFKPHAEEIIAGKHAASRAGGSTTEQQNSYLT